MSVPRSRKRPSVGDDDPIAQLQATIDREEVRRKVMARRALVAVAVALVAVVASAVLLRGDPAAADHAASTSATLAQPAQTSPKNQAFRISIGVTGYSPSVIKASAGSPIVLSVERGQGCAAGFLIPSLSVDKDNSAGPVTVNLGRVPAGSYQFSCGMEMVTGTLVVK